MYLEKLELQGFKSFAQKTTLEFAPGITAIVGPNGSGKSNIADAVKWIMGEQSVKTLRSKKSEDVIFAGTNDKARLGMAEASLYLNNEDGQMPIEYSHVVLTRRLYRSGESEYLINKNRVRLLDVQDMLARAGFGQKTYSVIGQGMIDRILSAGPKEKRELFEEAAGIKQYQIKKQVSLNKLDLSKQNLIHVSGLLEEILPRLRSLKRQANKAQKKEEIEKNLRIEGERYFNHVWNFLRENKNKIQDKVEGAYETEKQLGKGLEEIRKNLETIEKSEGFLEKMEKQRTLDKLKAEENVIRGEIALIEGRIQLERERNVPVDLIEKEWQRKELSKTFVQVKQNLSNIGSDLTRLEKQLDREIATQKSVLGEIRKTRGELESLQKERISPKFSLEKIIYELDKIHQEQNNFLGELEKVKNINELKDLKEKSKRHGGSINKLLLELEEEGKRERGGSEDEFKKIQQSLNQLFSKKSTTEAAISELKIKIAVLKSKEELNKKQIGDLSTELEFLDQKLAPGSKKNQPNFSILGAKLLKEKEKLVEKERSLRKEIEVLEKSLLSRFMEEKSEKEKIFSYEKSYRKKQEELNKLKDYIRELEINRAKISTEQELVENEIKEVFGDEYLNVLIKKFEKEPNRVEQGEIQNLKLKIGKLKKQVIQIGGIDKEVLAEYTDCEKRYMFFSNQQKDLEEAISSLKKVIDELNKIIDEKFKKAFESINNQFQNYFKILFGGGRAKLVKTRADDEKLLPGDEQKREESRLGQKEERDNFLLSNINIDIKATPPGKRLTDLNMLSGGEKALTSIALILAIIANNPSPFIVLDEVDATLDEANSSRYAQILTSVAKNIQFITITHNREMMKYANTIYGATMETSGVTKLLSVKLENIPAE
jgi:chromosome segregation protein